MTLQELLTSDMDLASLVALARRAWSWWMDELAGMAPPSWRARFKTGPRHWAGREADGCWRYWRDGRELRGSTPRRADPVCLLLPTGAVLTRTLKLPAMASVDVKRMLDLDLDRLSPLKGELVAHDFEIVDRGGPARPMAVRLGVVRRNEAEDLLGAALAGGLKAGRLAVLSDGAPAYDFLPTLRGQGRRRVGVRTYWWAAVAALMLLNLAVLVGRDVADLDSLKGLVDAQRPGVAAVGRLRARVESEAADRADLLTRGRRSDPLPVLDALTRAFPAGTWTRRLEWNGHAIRLIGYRPAGVDMAAVVRGTGRFANPRMLPAETSARTVAGEPFDLTAESRATP